MDIPNRVNHTPFIFPISLRAIVNWNISIFEESILAWHSGIEKRKKTGGKKRAYRTKRLREQGSSPVQTMFSETQRKNDSRISRIVKTRLVSTNYVNVSNPVSGKTERLEILDVIRNPANVDYNRRGVITKGVIIRTENGLAKIVSRPGQHGILNAIYIEE